MLYIHIVTLFPEIFKGPFENSIIKRALQKELVDIQTHNLRDWSEDKRRTVDDRPFGGGVGMILKPEPIFKAVEDIKKKSPPKADQPLAEKVILLTPQGSVFNQKKANELSKHEHLILICGHYEGVDERVRDHLVDEEISIGDYILTGGEIPAMVVIDAVVRLLPNVLEKEKATKEESFQPLGVTQSKALDMVSNTLLLEYPQYTRPENFRGFQVPEILLSGNHKKIERWRREKALERTKKQRPDLLKSSKAVKK